MTQIGRTYAQGLYALAKDEALTDTLLRQLDTLAAAFAEEPAFLRLLSIPSLSKQERLRVLDNSFRDRIHPYLLNFLKILTEKGYISHFPDCCKAFREQYNADNGILPVTAVTAVSLTRQQTARLTEKLAVVTGKRIVLTNRIDPDCLGGVRLDYDGQRLDGTIRNRLRNLGALLKNT